jgi:hypothetical protein
MIKVKPVIKDSNKRTPHVDIITTFETDKALVRQINRHYNLQLDLVHFDFYNANYIEIKRLFLQQPIFIFGISRVMENCICRIYPSPLVVENRLMGNVWW